MLPATDFIRKGEKKSFFFASFLNRERKIFRMGRKKKKKKMGDVDKDGDREVNLTRRVKFPSQCVNIVISSFLRQSVERGEDDEEESSLQFC